MDLSQYRDAFRQEVTESMLKGHAALDRLTSPEADAKALDDIKRFFHTLAGAAALMQYNDVAGRCRVHEERCRVLQEQADLPAASECVAWKKELEAMKLDLLAP